MLIIKNKSISLLWELKSIFMQFLGEKIYCIDLQHGHLVTWLQTKNAASASSRINEKVTQEFSKLRLSK